MVIIVANSHTIQLSVYFLQFIQWINKGVATKAWAMLGIELDHYCMLAYEAKSDDSDGGEPQPQAKRIKTE